MPNKTSLLIGVFFIAVTGFCQSPSALIPWSDFIIPLPQEISVGETVRVAPGQVRFETASNASPMVTQSVAALQELYQAKCGASPTGTDFIIQIGRLASDGSVNGKIVEGAKRLKTVPHSDQAYLICPNGSNGLVVAAWDDRGVFYGVQTLSQLLTAKLMPGEIIVPLASITDWPDFDERGVWNVDYKYPGIIPWMAAYKLNFTHISVEIILKKEAPAECPRLPMDLIREAKNLYAFKMNPHCTHYDFWFLRGTNTIYPEIVGQGDSARHPLGIKTPKIEHFRKARCPCATHPKFQELVTDWVRSAAAQGVLEISLWLSEFAPQQCACKNCLRDGPRQWELETKVSIAAIQTVQKEYPDLIGHIFFTLSTTEKEEQDSAACLALIPTRGVKVEKAYGRNKAFDAYAAAGNWVANYGLTISAANLRERIRDYHSNHYSAVYAIGAANQIQSDQVLQALAEWTWNVNGRDKHAFNKAYATRRNIPNPDQFAEWEEIIRPLTATQGHLHNTPHGTTSVIMPLLWDETLTAMAAHQPLPPYFPKPAALTNCLSECERAMVSATAAGEPYLIERTMFLKIYFQAIQQLAVLHAMVIQAPGGKPDHAEFTRGVKALLDLLNSSLVHLDQEAILRQIDPKIYSSRYKQFITETGQRLANIGADSAASPAVSGK